jgi:hypothetical protein
MRQYLLTVLPLALAASLCLAVPAQPASLTGPEILKRALDLQAGLQDYTATVQVSVNMPGVQMPQRTAKLYFKRPDKLHVESKGVVMIPRQALLMGDLGTQLAKRARVLLAGKGQNDGAPLYFLKVLPPEGQATTDRILVWVRGDRFTIEKLEVYKGGEREIAVQWEHQLVGGRFWLMRRLKAEVRGRQTRQRTHGPSDPDTGPAGTGPGTITVVFSGVRVNTGLPDSLFVERKP